MSKIGKNIKKIRTVKNLNQQDLATFLGLSRASIGAYEEERAEPKIESLIKLANHYNLDLGRLINSDLTVNEIHGFKQVEHLIINEEEISTPPKLQSLNYYTLRNKTLKLNTGKIKWPSSNSNEGFAVQLTSSLCILFFEKEKSSLETNLEVVYRKDDKLFFGFVKGISKNEIRLENETISLTDKNVVYYQPMRLNSDLESRLFRLEKIVDGLL